MRTLPLLLALLLPACTSSKSNTADQYVNTINTFARQPKLHHIVLFDLKDPADATALARDSANLLTIPGVTNISVGQHIDVGRPNAIADYDIAVLVGLTDTNAYRAYLTHPTHEELITNWRPKITSTRIIDFGAQ